MLLPPALSSTLQFSMVFSLDFMTSPDILYILRQFIIQFWGAISFLGIISPKFFRLIFLSLGMRRLWYKSSVPLVPLRHPLCYWGNNPQLIRKLNISTLIFTVRIFCIISRQVMGLYLSGALRFSVSFWIRVIFPSVIHLDTFSSFIIILLLECFPHQRQLKVFQKSLRNSNYHHVSRTLHSILADLNKAVVPLFRCLPVLAPILCWLYQEHQLQLV